MEEKKVAKAAVKRAGMTVKAKKKSAIARAIIKKGTGKVKVNHMNINSCLSGYVKELVLEPVRLAGDALNEYDIEISVSGSGFMSQAIAIRSCIAKALVKAKGKKLKDIFVAYDRTLLVDDTRRVESKKPLGRKARKRRQKSKR